MSVSGIRSARTEGGLTHMEKHCRPDLLRAYNIARKRAPSRRRRRPSDSNNQGLPFSVSCH